MRKIRTDKQTAEQLKQIYRNKKKEIVSRLKEFKRCRSSKNDEDIFSELAFCLLTPQSRAKSCWDAIKILKKQNLLFKGSVDQIKPRLRGVRFHNKKARYLVGARTLFDNNGMVSVKTFLNNFSDIHACRDWLVKNIKGIGYKEASHFLRNMGLGENIAILDRHILKNLHLLGIIDEIPKSMSRAKYLQIEKKMYDFAEQIDIPLSHLDLLLWYKETGEIFK